VARNVLHRHLHPTAGRVATAANAAVAGKTGRHLASNAIAFAIGIAVGIGDAVDASSLLRFVFALLDERGQFLVDDPLRLPLLRTVAAHLAQCAQDGSEDDPFAASRF